GLMPPTAQSSSGNKSRARSRKLRSSVVPRSPFPQISLLAWLAQPREASKHPVDLVVVLLVVAARCSERLGEMLLVSSKGLEPIAASVPCPPECVRLAAEFDRDHFSQFGLGRKVGLHLVEGDEAALELREHELRRLNPHVRKVAVDELAPIELAARDHRL